MAWKLPGLGENNQGVPEMTDLKLKGQLLLGSQEILKEDTALVTGIAKVFEKEITCSNGTAQTGAICTIPLGAVILDIVAYCTEAFDGDVTTTFEVGILGNTDKYIDPVDCPVTLAGVMNLYGGTNNDQKFAEVAAAAIPIIYTYTNTASATTGKMKVKVIYA